MDLYQIAKSGGSDPQRLSKSLLDSTNSKKEPEIGPRNFAARRNPERSCGLGKFVIDFIACKSGIPGNP